MKILPLLAFLITSLPAASGADVVFSMGSSYASGFGLDTPSDTANGAYGAQFAGLLGGTAHIAARPGKHP